MELLNLLNFIETQRQERYRAFIIWGEAMSGKTNFARRFAQVVGADYLDLLAHVAASRELKASIDLLDPMRLRDLLLHLPTQSQYVVIDNPDFLLNTWSDAQRREFFHIVEKLDNVQTDKVFCFVLQRDETLLERPLLPNTRGEARVIELKRVQELYHLHF